METINPIRPLKLDFENDSMVSVRYSNINFEDEPKKDFREALQKQLDHPFYQNAESFRDAIKRETLEKAAKKYPEPFNPNSWTIEQLAKHAMAENYDQTNYIYGMYERLQTQEREVNLLNKIHLEVTRLLESALTVKTQNKDTYIGYALETLKNHQVNKLVIDIYSCGECGQAFCVEKDAVPKTTPCCESELFEFSHSGKVVNDK